MHPVAFKIGNFAIYFYGLMMVVAYIIYLIIARYTRKYEDFDFETALDISIYLIIGGVIGARLFYVGLNLEDYLKQPVHIFLIREGGLSWHGALIGGFFGMVAMSKAKKMSLGKLCDFAAINSMIALAIGRIGCFLNGCCYGRISHLPWAVEFTGAGIRGHRHPTQIYETLLLVIGFFIMLKWWKNKKFDGEMTMGMFAMYGIIRFAVEIFRENTASQFIGGIDISLAQYLSIAMTIIFTGIIIYKRKTLKNEDAAINEDNCIDEAQTGTGGTAT